MMVRQAACQLLGRYTLSTLAASCVCWIVLIVTGLWERLGSFQTQHKSAHDHQRAYRRTTATTARNIRLIVETIITSHTCIAFFVSNITLKARTHTSYRSVLSVHMYSITIQTVTAFGPVTEISASIQDLISSQPSNLVMNYCLDMAVASLMYHCKYINKFVLVLRKSAVGWVIFTDIPIVRWRQARNNHLQWIWIFI